MYFLLINYILIINLITFLLFGLDKFIARHKYTKNRISEKNLLRICLIGGLIGGWGAMSIFRHKTGKRSFKNYMIVISIVYVIGAFLLLFI